jgi:hypothetical protein
MMVFEIVYDSHEFIGIGDECCLEEKNTWCIPVDKSGLFMHNIFILMIYSLLRIPLPYSASFLIVFSLMELTCASRE